MFRNAALLLMADPNGATFIDIPQCFTDPAFVKSKLKYVTDKAVYDYWTKEFPASQKSNDAGEVITWFTSKCTVLVEYDYAKYSWANQKRFQYSRNYG